MGVHRTLLRRPLGVLVATGGLLAAGLTIAAPASAATTTRTVDDSVTSGANRFGYSGSWRVCRGCDQSALQRSFHYATRPGAAVTLTFTGTRATLYGFVQPGGGTATVLVDGRVRATVGLAGSGHRRPAAVYTTPVLRNGRHTVTLRVAGHGGSRMVSVDRAVITAAGLAPTAAPIAVRQPARPAPGRTASATPPGTAGSGGGGTGGGGAGVASFTFDDGQAGQYANAAPALRAAGMHGTFYIISDAMGWGAGSMSGAQVRQLAAEGNEIGSHSRDHAHLAGMSAAAVEAEFADSRAALRSQAGVTPTTCAYPFGDSDATVRAVAAKYFTGCRGVSSGTNSLTGPDRYDLAVFYVHTSTTASDVRAAADAARAAGSWVIFVYHGVGSVGSGDDVTTAQFTAQVEAVRASGVTVRTVGQVLG